MNVQTLENHPEMQNIIACIYIYMHCISRHALSQTCIYMYMHGISHSGRGSGFQMCRTCDIQDVDIRHRTCDIVRDVRCRTSTYDIVRHTYDIVRVHLNISYTMSYVGNGYTMSYVHDIRYRMFISYTTSYVRTMSHVNIRYRMSDVRCRTSVAGGRFRCFKGTRSPAHSTGK